MQQAREDAKRQQLEGDSRIVMAARVASTFGLDPVAVLSERRPLARLVRLAAHNVIVRDHNRRS